MEKTGDLQKYHHQTRRFICTLLLALLVVDSVAPSATAQEQTVTLALYQGLNLEQGALVSTPEVIAVVFCGAATELFVLALDRDLYAFPLADRGVLMVQASRRGSWR